MARLVSPPRDLVARLGAARIPGLSDHDRDEMAVPSYTHSNPLIRWLMWRRYKVIASLLERGAESALEFGCGMGLFLPTLAATHRSVSAIDLFPGYAQQLVAELGLDVRFAPDLSAIPDGSLDHVVAADVMEHLDDPAQVARTFRAKLKPTGRLLVSGPTENVAYRVGRVLAGFAGKGDYHHTDIARLEGIIEASGFSRVRRKALPFPGLPPLFVVLSYARGG
jgi:2-polyprenyl-3-methyl-5-hydroxy-6-metoxy-1,4-benzoquinol methylase